MAQAVAYECDLCKGLTKDIFTVVVDSEKHHFTLGEQHDQPKLVLSVCRPCLGGIGEVITDALLG
jgi:hypothetical protein